MFCFVVPLALHFLLISVGPVKETCLLSPVCAQEFEDLIIVIRVSLRLA